MVVPLRGVKQSGGGEAEAIITNIIINHLNSCKIMSRKHYDETRVIRSLLKKKSISINTVSKTIEIVKDATDVGNGSWGKIDYLCKVHGYFVCRTVSVRKIPSLVLDDSDNNLSTHSKRDKFNMAAMSKAAMKRAKTK